MSDKWEVVGGGKKAAKPKTVGNGQAKAAAGNPNYSPVPGLIVSSNVPGAGSNAGSSGRRKKFKGPRESKIAPLPSLEGEDEEPLDSAGGGQKDKSNKQQQKKSQKPPGTGSNKQTPKVKDLETALKNISPGQLTKFYTELTQAGTTPTSTFYNQTVTPANSDVYVSWIKYSADALNTKLLQLLNFPTTTPELLPNNLHYPQIPSNLLEEIRSIITETAKTRPDVDVIGLSFSNLMSFIPTVIQRGDPGWGFLIFLRELCRLDPDLPIRKSKTILDLMESYGNKKEIGICVLWTVAQAALDSENILKIVSTYLLPYYSFKHYKNFVLSTLSALSESPIMDGDNVIEPKEFEEFFETSFDPKKRKDFEKFYPKIRDLTLRNLRSGRGPAIFFMFLNRLSDRDFLPLSPYGQEVFEIIHGCLAHDPTVIPKWKDEISKYSKESFLLLQYLSKHPERINYSKRLESTLITSDEFATACVKLPEMLRIAKKLQTGVKRVEEERKRKGFSWKFLCFVVLLLIVALLYLDISENGKGLFPKSKTGKLLESYGLLDEATFVIEKTVQFSKKSFELAAKAFLSVRESLRPLLQVVEKQIQTYIPQVKVAFQFALRWIMDIWEFLYKFLSQNIFVGPLSPESLRKFAKDTLTLVWTQTYHLLQYLYSTIEKYLSDYLK